VKVASIQDIPKSLTRHPEPTQQRVESPFLCLCYTISHGLGPNEPTVSQGFMQDIPSLKILEPYSLHHGLTKRCVRLEKDYKESKGAEEGKSEVRFHKSPATRACDADVIGHVRLPFALHLALTNNKHAL
jgi:hypothetical protein